MSERELEFEGIASGDCECFCWEVSEEEYIKVCGEEDHQRELQYRRKTYEEQKEWMKEEHNTPPEKQRWTIYPNDILNALLDKYPTNEKLKVKVSIERL
jgi:hypothetical protein